MITGGLGGIGLALAQHLARICKARLVLLSRRAPDAVQRHLLREIESGGGELRVAALDIADTVGVRSLVDEVGRQWGRIDGVIHAAGVAGGSVIARTDLAEIERVLRPKVAGTRALAEALRGREPDFVLLCSSLTASLGGPGQVSYAAANAWMDAFAATQSARSPGRWHSVQWDAWAEVGMAARAGGRAPRGAAAGRELLHEWTFSPATFWPWGEHRVEGAALLPGTAFLELFRQAVGGSAAVELVSVALYEPLVQAGESSCTVRVLRAGDELLLESEAGAGVREHARARVGDNIARVAVAPLAEIAARCSAPATPRELGAAEGIVITAGPRWQIEGRYLQGRDEAIGWLDLPARFNGDLALHPLHPALFDVAISYYLAFVEGSADLLPWRYEKVRVFAPLTARLVSHVRQRSRTERALVLDADLRDETGRLLVQVEGYTLVRTDPARASKILRANPRAMTPAEGIETFLRVLATAEPVVCVSTVDWKSASRASPATPTAGTDKPAGTPGQPARTPRPEATGSYREPGSAREKLMAAVWAEVLGYDRIGLDDDLFGLGADSLTALQASARVKELTGSELSLQRFFANPTIVHLAEGLPPEGGLAVEDSARDRETWEEGDV
jgi:aryl carrier-like protein